MKKIIFSLSLLGLVGCSSLNHLNTEHKAQKKELKLQQKKETEKLKTKQSLEFGVYIAGKIKLLKEFFK